MSPLSLLFLPLGRVCVGSWGVVFRWDQWWLEIFHLKCQIKSGRTSADEASTALMESSGVLSYQHRLAPLSFSRLINRTLSSTWRGAIWCSHGLIISLTQNWLIYSWRLLSATSGSVVSGPSESGLTHKSRLLARYLWTRKEMTAKLFRRRQRVRIKKAFTKRRIEDKSHV